MANSNLTERAIHEAFVELLNKKALDRITVRDITEQAGISRNTFYYHYQDVPALLEDILEKDADRVIADYPRLNSIEECLEAAMQFARANRRIIMHIFNSGSSTNIASLWRVCEHFITTYADTVFPDAPISDRDRMLFIRFTSCSLPLYFTPNREDGQIKIPPPPSGQRDFCLTFTLKMPRTQPSSRMG